MWVKFVRQAQRFADDLRAEERRAHPAAVQARLIDGKQEILDGSAETLHSHRHFSLLARWIRIRLKIAQIKAGDDKDRRAFQSFPGPGEAPGDNRLVLPVERELRSPGVAHRLGQREAALRRLDDDEPPRLATMR